MNSVKILIIGKNSEVIVYSKFFFKGIPHISPRYLSDQKNIWLKTVNYEEISR